MTQFFITVFLYIALSYMTTVTWHKFGAKGWANSEKRNLFWFFIASEIVGALIMSFITMGIWTGIC